LLPHERQCRGRLDRGFSAEWRKSMKLSKTLLATAALASLTAAMPASAATLVYNYTSAQNAASNFSFTADSNPTPQYPSADGFFADISNYKQNGIANTGVTFAYFYSQSAFGGINVNGFTPFGPQLYSGTSTAPTLLTGSFTLFADVSQTAPVGTLNVMAAAVPEPATWAMMLVGFGMLGASMRYRRRSTKAVLA